MQETKTPADLARALYERLKRRKHGKLPSVRGVERIFDVLFAVSLRTEEAQPITCSVTYIDPKNPDPRPPRRIVLDRWGHTPLSTPLPLNERNLLKLAQAVDPSATSLAIFCTRERPFIWGILDQFPAHNLEFITMESDEGPEMPGQFQAEITGLGTITAFVGRNVIGSLRRTRLVRHSYDVLRVGPISEMLESRASRFATKVLSQLPTSEIHRTHWRGSIISAWLGVIRRILIRMRNYHHGGALLFVPNGATDGLRPKYLARYDRLGIALEKLLLARILKTEAEDAVMGGLDEHVSMISADIHLDMVVNGNLESEAASSLRGSILMVSSLSRIDGLVLMDDALNVHAFGVEITESVPPNKVWLAGDPQGSKARRRLVDYEHHGTRHRSMMRFCASHPESLGFVVSQDGDVRAISTVDGDLILWDEIQLYARLA